VARAWVDDVFRAALLDDANAAVAKHMGIGGGMSAYSTKLTAVVNTADVHNVIVCTLCRYKYLSIDRTSQRRA